METKELQIRLGQLEWEKKPQFKQLGYFSKMKQLSEAGDVIEVQIVDGADTSKKGWVEKKKLKDEQHISYHFLSILLILSCAIQYNFLYNDG